MTQTQMTGESTRSDASGPLNALTAIPGEWAARHLRAAPSPAREHASPHKHNEPGPMTEAAFRSIAGRCRATGGLACADAMSRLLENQSGGDFASLAHMVRTGKLFGFPWRTTFWIPIFQFDLADLTLKRTPLEARNELGRSFHGWDVATWFTSPNVWLKDRLPVELLDSDSLSVLSAARADRFVAEG